MDNLFYQSWKASGSTGPRVPGSDGMESRDEASREVISPATAAKMTGNIKIKIKTEKTETKQIERALVATMNPKHQVPVGKKEKQF